MLVLTTVATDVICGRLAPNSANAATNALRNVLRTIELTIKYGVIMGPETKEKEIMLCADARTIRLAELREEMAALESA